VANVGQELTIFSQVLWKLYGSITYSKTALSHQSFHNCKISGHFEKKQDILLISGISGLNWSYWRQFFPGELN